MPGLPSSARILNPKGEIQMPQQLYQKQVASTIAMLLGYNFTGNHPVAKSIDFKKPVD